MKSFNRIILVISLGSAVLLSSCVPTVSDEMLSKAHDDIAPEFTDLVPEDGYAYGAYTSISGTVTDLDANGESGKISTLTLEIVDITDPITLTIEDDGSFSSGELMTYGDTYSGPITVKLTATDWNGNITEENLNYAKADGEITNFSIERGNGELTLSWDGIDTDGSYVYSIKELYYGLGTVEIESNEQENSYTWKNLDNGKNYSFYIYAQSASDDTILTSSIKDMMPLSPLNCTPVITLNSDSTDLLWPELTDADKYVVQRATSLDGTWETIGITAKNYLHYPETPSIPYYYHVYPYSTEAPVEEELIEKMACTQGGAETGEHLNQLNYKGLFAGDFKSITVSGNYAYSCTGSGLQIIDITNPASPASAGSFSQTGAEPIHFTINGIYGFLTCKGFDATAPDLIILDMSDPATPVKLSESSGTHPYFGLRSFLYGNYLYMLMDYYLDTTYNGLDDGDSDNRYQTLWGMYDISDPSAPEYLGYNANFPESGDMFFIHHYTSGKNIALINNVDSLKYLEINSPLFLINETPSSNLTAGYTDPSFPHYLGRMSYSDSTLHFIRKYQGDIIIEYFDISSNLYPGSSTGTSGENLDTNEPGPIHNIIALGDYAVYSGIQGIGSYANVNINLASTVNDGACTAYDVAVMGSYAYLATSAGLKIYEIDWLTAP